METYIWFNLISVALVLILGVKGLVNGIIKEIFGIIGIIGGIFIAARFAENFGTFISDNIFSIQNNSSIYIVGFTALLFSFWIICLFFSFILSKLITFSGLRIIDRLLGFIFGSLKIFLLFAVVITLINAVGFIKDNYTDKYLKNSFMYEAFLKTGSFIINLDYSSLDNTIDDFTTKTKESIYNSSDYFTKEVESKDSLHTESENIGQEDEEK